MAGREHCWERNCKLRDQFALNARGELMTLNIPEKEAIVHAARDLLAENPGSWVPARLIAERAGTDPDETVGALFEMAAANILKFNRAGGGSPDNSFVYG
jgi:hypothetical protein